MVEKRLLPVEPELTADERVAVKLVRSISVKSRENAAEGKEDKGLDEYGARVVNSPEYVSGMNKIHNFMKSLNEDDPHDRSY